MAYKLVAKQGKRHQVVGYFKTKKGAQNRKDKESEYGFSTDNIKYSIQKYRKI